MSSTSSDSNSGFLFTVEILVEGPTNGKALEKLLTVLNAEAIRDYRVKSGVNLGKLIELNTSKPKERAAEGQAAQPQAPATAPETKKQKIPKMIELIQQYIANNALVRISVVKGKGVKFSMPCRILSWDESSETVTVYHVDEKRVYLLKLNEIDDFSHS